MGAANPVDGIADDAEVGAAAFEHDAGAAFGIGGLVAADMEAVDFDI